ncbi:HD domain-containing phosphohydrolase [Stieleria varia]|uniref:Cyclic di-GMP phosphodiesterase response regulator RpfG n=1 Tax=Stieleria varia TaxID=2528005 RepID=A0A5C6B9L7_9BACT|nr:HD domain-containing phosphohydrolase [Stieleria varia]TWU08131.1 Cyclic di-GMP phosphodiesterase response regulator RpfG [Stieleria varia]
MNLNTHSQPLEQSHENDAPLDPLRELADRIDSLVKSYADNDQDGASVGTRTVQADDAVAATPRHAETLIDGSSSLAQQTNVVGNTAFEDGEAAKLLRELRAAKIAVIDDEEVNVRIAVRHLRDAGFVNVVSITDSRKAIEMLKSELPDAILLDICMPQVSGIDLLRIKRSVPKIARIPAIILTASTDREVKRQALDLGAHDFLTKPLDPSDLVPRLRNAVVTKKYIDHIAKEKATLAEMVHRRTSELESSRQQLILSLARAAEHRDNETGNHVIRVGRFAGIIARELGWKEDQTAMLEQAAQLHDVGKIGVPDSILFKPGKLEPREFDIMKKHCSWGRGIIEPFSGSEFQALKAHARLGESILHIRSSPMLMMASRIAQTHHENWDGTGYPLGLAGEDIPIEGRITTVADVFDALSSKRPYKDPFPREKCMSILNSQRGTKFDPRILDAFFARTEDIVRIQIELMDEEEMGSVAHELGQSWSS